MDGNNHVNDKENNSPFQQKEKKICDVRGPCNGKVSIGRRILASRQEVWIGRNFPSIAQQEHIVRRQNNQVSLKDGKGLVVGRRIIVSEVQTEDDVAGLILFPHQVAVCIEEVYASGHQKQNEDGQLLRECIGQTVRWSRSAVHGLKNIALNAAHCTPMLDHFNFNEDMFCMNANKLEKRNESQDEHVGGEENSLEINAEGLHACDTFSVSRVDGLAPNVQKRKYSKTKRVTKEKGERKIGSSRAQKVSLVSVELDLKSNLCSRGCLQKLNARAILMKRFKAWRSDEYEERALWILENLTEN